MSQASSSKSMTIGESGLSVIFAASAFLCVIAAAKAGYKPPEPKQYMTAEMARELMKNGPIKIPGVGPV